MQQRVPMEETQDKLHITSSSIMLISLRRNIQLLHPFFLCVSLAFTYLQVSSQGAWTQKANFPGTPRGDAFYFSIGNFGYMGAGADGNSNWLNDVWQYDAVNNTWTQKGNFSGAARWQGSAFSIGAKGYFGMGSGPGAGNDFWEYDPASDSWTQKASIPAEKRSATVGFAIGSKGYIGTGWGGDSVSTNHNDFWEYDPAVNSWTQKANVPGARSFAIGFSIGSKGYVGTGHDSTNNNRRDDLWEYDPSTDTWLQKANYPGGNRVDIDGAHFTIGNYAYVGTGNDIPNSTQTLYNDFWKYDPLNDSWTQIPNLPAQSRIGAIGFSINNQGYIGTGFWFTNVAVGLNDLWSFTDTIKVDSLPSDTLIGPNAETDTLIIPNTFTPGNDGKNDFFVPIKNTGTTIKEISIFNRWGILVHHVNFSKILWDGKTKTGNAPDGTYYWVVKYQNSKGTNTQMGYLLLIK